MKKRFVKLLTGMLVMSMLAGCGGAGNSSDTATTGTDEIHTSQENTGNNMTGDNAGSTSDNGVTDNSVSDNNGTDAAVTTVSTDEKIDEIISRMSTEQKLAQMMVVALRSGSSNATELTGAYEEFLGRYDFGGVILFGANIVDAEQTVNLIRGCQTAAINSEMGIPMLMCVDQEGGLVNRVSFGTTGSGNMALAATGNTSLTEECADTFGQEISALGFNMDFAPVSDVNNNPSNPVIGTRSFSDDPAIVAEHVTAFIRGLERNNVATALKHFPGHGNVGEDSHTHLPLSELTSDELKECELIPFQAGIDAGAEMIMTAHIQYPNIEQNTYISKMDGNTVYLPATLSHTIMTDILRNELGYDGVIITDSMTMDAIASHFDMTDAAVLAINAGVDIILCPVDLYQGEGIDTFPVMDDYMNKLIARVEAGDISVSELDDSVRRILRLKFRYGIMTDTLSVSYEEQLAEVAAVVGSYEHHAREWEITQQAITLLKNDNGALPLDGNSEENVLVLIPNDYRRPAVEYAISRLQKEELLSTSSVNIVNYNGLGNISGDIKILIDNADTVMILSQSLSKNDFVCKVIEQAHQNEDCNVVFLSLNLPYDVACYEDVDAVLCAYNTYGSAHDAEGNGPFNLNIAVAVCTAFGEAVPHGTLPVNIPMVEIVRDGEIEYSDELLYYRGYGLTNWGL